MKYFILVVAFLVVSCGAVDLKTDFVDHACKTYVECEFSETSNENCREFSEFNYELIPEESKKECVDCLKSIGCDMWNNATVCEPCF